MTNLWVNDLTPTGQPIRSHIILHDLGDLRVTRCGTTIHTSSHLHSWTRAASPPASAHCIPG